MNKLIAIVISIVVIGSVAVALLTKNNTSNSSNSSVVATTKTSSYNIVDACVAFTQASADAILGTGAKPGDNSLGNTSSDDINVSTCTYSGANSMAATLLARSAKTATGATSNVHQFTTIPAGASSVSGYGDKAYYDPAYGQLNILKNNNWYILTNGGLRPSDKTLAGAKLMADQIISKL
jgi:hypothetical protein